MATFTVENGKRYRAHLQLTGFERFAGNDLIIARLRDAGFTDVKVSGEGTTREAEGIWGQNTTTAPLPPQVAGIVEI
jgi:hypothetical protein